MKKITLTIDDKKVEVDEGVSVFQAAEAAGVFVPHYCYHPDLSVAGVCRMCLVEIDDVPKLQISCNTPAKDGMVVKTNSEKARGAQKGSLELHLINHPLDCPICDKAGECKLQDFYRGIGLYKSRMEFDNKVHKPKVVDIGTIVLDSERCILCSRCTRFTEEVTDTHELVFVNRGDRTTLKTYDDGPLRNDYTGNLADICPVGALTAKDFRFQQRVWFLEKQNSACTMCARGCSTQTSYNPKTKKLYRVEPRRNPSINKSWICDTGRWNYQFVYAEDRIQTPQMKTETQWSEMTWHQAFGEMKADLDKGADKVLVLLSTQLTNEELIDAQTTLSGSPLVRWVDDSVVGEKEAFDGILKHKDQTPNALGFEKVFKGLKQSFLDTKAAEKAIAAAESIWILGVEGYQNDWMAELIQKAVGKRLVIHATNHRPWMEAASTLLPNTSSFEKSGSFVNALGILQQIRQSLPQVHLSRDAHCVLQGVRNGHDRERRAGDLPQTLFTEKTTALLLKQAKGWKELEALGEGVA